MVYRELPIGRTETAGKILKNSNRRHTRRTRPAHTRSPSCRCVHVRPLCPIRHTTRTTCVGPRGARAATQTRAPYMVRPPPHVPDLGQESAMVGPIRGVRACVGDALGHAPPARPNRTTRRSSWGACGTRTCSSSGARSCAWCLGPCGAHTLNRTTRAPGVPHEPPLAPQAHGRRPACASAPRVGRAACLKAGS